MTRPRWTPERLSTTARLEACPHCDALVIRALDNPRAGLDTRLDPIPLTLVEEIKTRLAGRWTYDLINRGPRKEIAYRDEWRLKKRKWPVLAAHVCPGPIPYTALSQLRVKNKEKAADDRPPF